MDPFSRLFDMYITHNTAQLRLATKLLELRGVEQTRKTADEKLFAGALDETEKEHFESRFAAADDQASKLREDIKGLVETLTGVALDTIQEANL